jgi:hypothetical protein
VVLLILLEEILQVELEPIVFLLRVLVLKMDFGKFFLKVKEVGLIPDHFLLRLMLFM